MTVLKAEVDPAEVGIDPARLGRLDRHFMRYVDDGRLPGWLITVSRNGRLAHVSAYGQRDMEAGLAAETRARDLIVPLLLLPLLVPVLIAAAEATKPLLELNQHAQHLGKWLGFLGLYDTVFLLLAVAVFDYLLED